MKYKLVESKNKENITHAVDDDFTFSIFDVDEVKTSNLNESVEKNATIEEDYNYSEYDKKLLVNRAKSIAQEIYKLYNRADVEEQGELPSAKEIAEDLLSNPKKVDMYARFLSKMKGSKTANRFVEKLINELASFKKKLVAMKPQTESLKKMLTEDISMGLFSFDFSCAYPDDVWKIYDDLCDEFGCDHVGYPEDIDYSGVGSGYETEYPNVFQSSVAFPHEDNDASDVAIISDRVRNIISKYVAEVEGTDLSTLGESFERSRRTSLNEAEVPIRLSKDDMMNSDGFDLGKKVKNEVDDANQKEAEEKERQRKEALKEEHKEIFDIINGDLSTEEKLNELFDKLVPASGKCDFVAGELIRALGKIRYRWYNDGDYCFSGYGIETCGNAWNYIMYTLDGSEEWNKANSAFDDLIKEASRWCDDNQYEILRDGNLDGLEDMYDGYLDKLSEAVLSWINNNPDKDFNETNDMFDNEYNDWMDLAEAEPKISIEFSQDGADYELFDYVERYEDIINYSVRNLVEDFLDDYTSWSSSANTEEDFAYADCVGILVPMSDACEFNNDMMSWCEYKLQELTDEFGEEPDEEEEDEEEDDDDIDESMNETFFGKGDKQKGGPVALDPEEDTEELRKKVKKIAKQAAENAKKADKQTKKKNCTDCEE